MAIHSSPYWSFFVLCHWGMFEEENQLPKEERGNQTYRLRQSGKSRKKNPTAVCDGI